MEIIVAPEAQSDLKDLYLYIAENNTEAAHQVALQISYGIEKVLGQFPSSGHPGRIHGTRELVIPKTPVIIVYSINVKKLEILRVYHHSRRWPDQF